MKTKTEQLRLLTIETEKQNSDLRRAEERHPNQPTWRLLRRMRLEEAEQKMIFGNN